MGLLEAAWGDSPGQRALVGIQGKTVKHWWPNTAEQAEQAAAKLAEGGWDAYFAPALFADQSRKKDQAQTVRALWIDADAGPGKEYASVKEAAHAVLDWASGKGLPTPTHVVNSGNGLHVYWVLDQAYPVADWLPVAQQLKQALSVDRVVNDAQVTADAARILRVPGTYNHKGDAPKAVTTLIERDHRPTLDQMAQAMPKLGPQKVVSSGFPADSEWDVPPDYPPGNADGIAEECQQMGIAKHHGGAVAEPFWRAMLSVLKRCEGGDILIHEWSKGDPRYDADQTKKKAESTQGPATCEHFSEVNPGGCAGCPHAGTVTSPVQLSTVAPEPPAEQAEQPAQESTWRISKSGPWTINGKGIFYRPPATDEDPEPEPQRMAAVPIWIEEVREKAREGIESDQSGLVLHWTTLDGREKQGLLGQSALGNTQQFSQWLGDHNLYAMVDNLKGLGMYLSHITRETMKQKGVREFHDTLGWAKDGCVIGATQVTSQGSKEALVQNSNPISGLHPKGSTAAWRKAIDKLDDPALRSHQVAVLSGFASTLYEPAGVQSAVVSLVGRSGAGKTLAAQAALSIYGDPEMLTQGSTSTANSVEQQLTTLKHLPHLLDEVTGLSARRITDHIYVAANGQGKGSLNRNRQAREAGTWRLTPIITSNTPVLEFSHDYVQEAHRRRLLELGCDSVFPSDLGKELHDATRANAGAPAEDYLKAVSQLWDKIPDLYDKAQAQVQKWVDVPDENRFGLWTLAGCLLGGWIAQKAGIIGWDPAPAVQEAAQSLQKAAEETETDEDRVQGGIADFLNDNTRYTSFWMADNNDMGDDTDAAVARWVDADEVAIHKRQLKEYLQQRGISGKAATAFMQQYKTAEGKRRLAPGAPAVGSITLDARAAGLLTEEDDASEGGET